MRIIDKHVQTYADGVMVIMTLDKKDAEHIHEKVNKLKVGKDYDVEIKDRARRSLNANAYHWQLVSKIAEVLKQSKYEVHNRLMQDYGTDWLDGDGKRVYVLMKDNDDYLRRQTEHYRPTDAVEDRKGTLYRWMVLLLPSHLMDSRQMSNLISGTVQEADSMGIQVLTQDELARLAASWKGGVVNDN